MDAPADLRDAVKRSLVAEVASASGQVRLKVTGTSMLPSIWPGDILTVKQCNAADLVPGRVVLCYRKQELVAHRLVGKGDNCLVTRGDSLLRDDPPFCNDELVGEVVSILRNGRCVDPSPAWWHSAGCWILRHSQMSARLLLGLRRRLRPN